MSRFEDAINLANHLGSTVSDGNGYSFLTDAANVRFEPENISVEDAIKKLKSVDAYVYQGTVENYNDLPTENVKNGDVYNVENAYLTYPAGTNFAAYYDENKQLHWDSLGGEFSVPVEDVKVNGTSVVNSKVANINVPIQSISQGGVAITPIGGNVEIPLPTIPDVPVQDVKDSAGNSLVTNKIAVTETPNDKVVEITPEIKSSEIKYPSLKAITEWVDANKSELNFQYAAAYRDPEKTQYVVIDIIAPYDYNTNNNTPIKVREYAGADETTINAVDYSMSSRIKKSSFSSTNDYTKYSAIFMWQNSPANYDLFQISIDSKKSGGKIIKLTNGNNSLVEPFLKYDSTNKLYYYGLKFNPLTDTLIEEYRKKYYPSETNIKSWFDALGIYNCFLSETIEFGQVYRVCPFNGYIYSDLSDTVKNLPDCDVIYTAISDVQVNGTSVVDNTIAKINVPIKSVSQGGTGITPDENGNVDIPLPTTPDAPVKGVQDAQGNSLVGDDKIAVTETPSDKVTEITTENENSTIKYPSVGALIKYVNNNKGKLPCVNFKGTTMRKLITVKPKNGTTYYRITAMFQGGSANPDLYGMFEISFGYNRGSVPTNNYCDAKWICYNAGVLKATTINTIPELHAFVKKNNSATHSYPEELIIAGHAKSQDWQWGAIYIMADNGNDGDNITTYHNTQTVNSTYPPVFTDYSTNYDDITFNYLLVNDVKTSTGSSILNKTTGIATLPAEKTYTAGDNITIDSTGKISAKDTTYKAGTNITISADNTISATGGGGGESLVDDVQDEYSNSLVTNKIAKLNNYDKSCYITIPATDTVTDDYIIQWAETGTYTTYGVTKYYNVGVFIKNPKYKEYFIDAQDRAVTIFLATTSGVQLDNGTRIHTYGRVLPAFELHFAEYQEVIMYGKDATGNFSVKTGWDEEGDQYGMRAFRDGYLQKNLYPTGRYFASYIHWWGDFYGNGYADIKVTDYLGDDCALPVASYAIKSDLYTYIDKIKVNGTDVTSTPTVRWEKTEGQSTGQTVDLELGQYSYKYADSSCTATYDYCPYVDPLYNTKYNWPWDSENSEYDYNRLIVADASTRYISCSMEGTGSVYIILLKKSLFKVGQIIDICPIDASSNNGTIVPYSYYKYGTGSQDYGWVPINQNGTSPSTYPLIEQLQDTGNTKIFKQYRFTRTDAVPCGWYITVTNYYPV